MLCAHYGRLTRFFFDSHKLHNRIDSMSLSSITTRIHIMPLLPWMITCSCRDRCSRLVFTAFDHCHHYDNGVVDLFASDCFIGKNNKWYYAYFARGTVQINVSKRLQNSDCNYMISGGASDCSLNVYIITQCLDTI